MASPKSVKSADPVAPAAPAEAIEADVADPGEAASIAAAQADATNAALTSKEVAATKPKTGKPDPKKTSWIEVELVDENGKGLPGVPYEVIASDESVYTGTTDEFGVGRIEGIEPGSYDITFPKLDKDAWEPA